MAPKKNIIAGVISDTHGLLRPEVKYLFENVDIILHAGDIGNENVLKSLNEIAPVIAVKGNVDIGTGLDDLPLLRDIKLGKFNISLIHDINDPKAVFVKQKDMVIFGHSHRPLIDKKEGAILFNPGSAGRRRFSLPVSAGLLFIHQESITPEIRYLNV